jgi:hypothetical protein
MLLGSSLTPELTERDDQFVLGIYSHRDKQQSNE